MKQNLALLLVIALLGAACEDPPSSDCEETELVAPKFILIAGQSNTHAGIGIDATLDAPAPGVYQLGRFTNDNCIIEATEPLDHHSRTASRNGFALTFSKLLSQHFQHAPDIIIVPCGYGGTGFADNRWNKGDDLYQDAVERINSLKTKFPDGEVLAILWHQGETDVLLDNQNFENDLDNFISDLRLEIGEDSVPFILGGMVPYWVNQFPDRQLLQQVLMETPLRVGMTGYADPEIPFVISKPDDTFDEIHFDGNGQRELGQRYFDQFLLLTE